MGEQLSMKTFVNTNYSQYCSGLLSVKQAEATHVGAAKAAKGFCCSFRGFRRSYSVGLTR